MAISYVGERVFNSGNSGITNATVQMPAGLAVNDFVIWFVAQQTNQTFTTPSGWTPVLTMVPGTSVSYGIYYRFATSGDTAATPPSYTITLGATGARVISAFQAYRGVHLTNPLDATPTTATGTTTRVNMPAISVVTANSWVVAYRAWSNNTTTTAFTTATGNLRDSGSTTSASSAANVAHGIADYIRSTTGSFTPDLTTTATPVQNRAVTIALRPAPDAQTLSPTAIADPSAFGTPTIVQSSVNATVTAVSVGSLETFGGAENKLAIGQNPDDTYFFGNPSFDRVDSASQIDNWGGNNAYLTPYTADTHSGIRSALITPAISGTDGNITSDLRPVTPGERWVSGIWLKQIAGTFRTVRIFIDWYNATNVLVSSAAFASVTASGSWQQLVNSGNVNIAPPGAVQAQLRIVFVGWTSGDQILVDDAQLERGISLSSNVTVVSPFINVITSVTNAGNIISRELFGTPFIGKLLRPTGIGSQEVFGGSENRIADVGNFEMGGTLSDYWTTAGGTSAYYTLDSHSGTTCLKLHDAGGTGDPRFFLANRVPVTPGQKVGLSAWVKWLAGTVKEVDLVIEWYDASGNSIQNEFVYALSPPFLTTTSWTRMAGSSEAPANATSVNVRVQTFGGVNGDDVLVDDINLQFQYPMEEGNPGVDVRFVTSLYALPYGTEEKFGGSENLFYKDRFTYNPDFEIDPVGSTSVTGWNVSSGAANTTLTIVNTDAYVGTKSLRVALTGSGVPWINSEYMACSPGDAFSTRVKVKWVSGTPRSMRADIRFWDSEFTLINTILGTGIVPTTTAWSETRQMNTSFEGTAVAPANAAYFTIRIVMLSPQSGDTCLVDAVQVERGGTPNTVWTDQTTPDVDVGATLNQTLFPTAVATLEYVSNVSVTMLIALSPTSIATANVFGSHSIFASINLSPTGVTSAQVFGNTTLTTSITLSLTGLGTAEAFGTHSIFASISLAPTGIVTANVFGSHSVFTSIALAPTAVASLESFGLASTIGSVSLSITGITSAQAFGATSLALNGPTLFPTGVPSLESFGSHTIFTSILVTTTGIATAQNFGAPSIYSLISLTPIGMGSVEAFGATSVTTFITLLPSGIISAQALGNPTTFTGLTLNLTGIGSQEVFGNPTLTLLTLLLLAGIGSLEAFGIPSVLGDSNVSPNAIGTLEAFGLPEAAFYTIVLPEPTPTAEAFGLLTWSFGTFVVVYPVSIASQEAVNEAFAAVAQEIDLAGAYITSAELFGQLFTTMWTGVYPESAESEEAFGRETRWIDLGQINTFSIETQEVFGTSYISATIELIPAEVVSEEVFGTLLMQYLQYVDPTGGLSVETFGTPWTYTFVAILPVGIASEEISDSQNVFTFTTLLPVGLASDEFVAVPNINGPGVGIPVFSGWGIPIGR
jgi:hypothetical protein